MRVALRLLRPAANQGKSPLWQDPVFGYFEQHGKTEFVPGEQYDISDTEKKRVLARNRAKELFKKEYLRREYDPYHFKYREGVVVDPAMFRWYAADRTQVEHFRYTPRTVFFLFGVLIGGGYLYSRFWYSRKEMNDREMRDGERLWWDRQDARQMTFAGNPSGMPCISD